MRAWLQRMAWKMEQWMQGRNGLDDLARHAYYLGLALLLFSLFNPAGFIGLPASAVLIYALFRAFSKNVVKRQAENAAYLRVFDQVQKPLKQRYLRFKSRKEYRFFKCKCGAVLRVKRGQGVKELVCPVCHEHMTRDTK